MIENDERKKLLSFLNNWISNKIYKDLDSLLKLKNIKDKDPNIRALAYQIYENNGVVKREKIKNIINKLDQNRRKVLRDVGVKFGRYHIFLFKLFKPKAVSLRLLLWKNYHQNYYNLSPPTFGLNFIDDGKLFDKNFMLLCGFEKFGKFYVRIDILERLFLNIIKNQLGKDSEIKLTPDMLNLLGCSKNKFLELIKIMNYRSFNKNNETFFKYNPKRSMIKIKNKNLKDNPFKVLSELNIK